MTAVLELRDIDRHYKSEAGILRVLEGAELVLNPGELVGLIGPSGSGKSTLLHTAGLLEKPEGGKVFLEGEDCMALNDKGRTRLRREKLGFVYQFHHLLAEFSALENVCMPLYIAGISDKEASARATSLLERVGLGERLTHKPAELSGGERQRVAIARALVSEPKCVLMDEPTGNLDRQTALEIHGLMKELSTSLATSFIVVTHDEALAAAMDRRLSLAAGKLHVEA